MLSYTFLLEFGFPRYHTSTRVVMSNGSYDRPLLVSRQAGQATRVFTSYEKPFHVH